MLAIVAAFKDEVKDYIAARKFRVKVRDGSVRFYESKSTPEVVVVDGAVGRVRAVDAARSVIRRYSPDLILSAGFAGGVQQGLKAGDVFLCDRLMAIEGPAMFWELDDALERSAGQLSFLDGLVQNAERNGSSCRLSGCLSVPDMVQSSSMKSWIGPTFPVSIIDMESYWVNEVAAECNIPHAVVRTVLDPVEQTLPAFVGKGVTYEGARSWERAARYLVSRPTEAPRLLHLASQVRVARASLGKILTTLDVSLNGASTGS